MILSAQIVHHQVTIKCQKFRSREWVNIGDHGSGHWHWDIPHFSDPDPYGRLMRQHDWGFCWWCPGGSINMAYIRIRHGYQGLRHPKRGSKMFYLQIQPHRVHRSRRPHIFTKRKHPAAHLSNKSGKKLGRKLFMYLARNYIIQETKIWSSWSQNTPMNNHDKTGVKNLAVRWLWFQIHQPYHLIFFSVFVHGQSHVFSLTVGTFLTLWNYPLVGGWATPLKNMKASWDDDIPKIWENRIHGNQTTNQPSIILEVYGGVLSHGAPRPCPFTESIQPWADPWKGHLRI